MTVKTVSHATEKRYTNLDEAKQQLLADNCPVHKSASGRAALFTQDPDGNIIELNQQLSP